MYINFKCCDIETISVFLHFISSKLLRVSRETRRISLTILYYDITSPVIGSLGEVGSDDYTNIGEKIDNFLDKKG